MTAALGLFPAAIATSIGSQAQKPLAIVVVGAMLCTLFLTRYMMPILYSYFPAPRGHVEGEDEHLVEGTNYAARSCTISRRIIELRRNRLTAISESALTAGRSVNDSIA